MWLVASHQEFEKNLVHPCNLILQGKKKKGNPARELCLSDLATFTQTPVNRVQLDTHVTWMLGCSRQHSPSEVQSARFCLQFRQRQLAHAGKRCRPFANMFVFVFSSLGSCWNVLLRPTH